jgi:hypothetical protein
MTVFKIDGILPIVPTPFRSDRTVDRAARPLLEFAISARVCGVCLPAYASEFYKSTTSFDAPISSNQHFFMANTSLGLPLESHGGTTSTCH